MFQVTITIWLIHMRSSILYKSYSLLIQKRNDVKVHVYLSPGTMYIIYHDHGFPRLFPTSLYPIVNRNDIYIYTYKKNRVQQILEDIRGFIHYVSFFWSVR